MRPPDSGLDHNFAAKLLVLRYEDPAHAATQLSPQSATCHRARPAAAREDRYL